MGQPSKSSQCGQGEKDGRAKTLRFAEITPLIAGKPLPLPMVGGKINAGFPSPADDYMDDPLDLNDRLIHNPAATFLVRVNGLSMINAGITPGDTLVVDKSETAKDGDIVVAVVNGEFTLKRFSRNNGAVRLVAENPDFPPIIFEEGDELYVWGVVKHAIKDF